MKIKKILSLALICILSLFLSACNEVNITRIATIKDDDDILMTIYAYDGAGEKNFGLMNFGHSFLSFENLTSQSIKIGKYDLPSGDVVTLSTYPISDHFGIWYNTESNYIKYYDKYNGRVSVTVGLKMECLETLTKYMKENDKWIPTKNCTNFSVGLWNALCSEEEKVSTPLIYTPSKLAKDIKTFTSYETNKEIAINGNVGYIDKNGDYIEYLFEKATVEECNA